MAKKNGYKLSQEADQDLEDIFDFTHSEFGFDQAVSYLQKFNVLFSELVQNPEIGKTRDEIKAGLRSFPQTSHIVFYRILKDHVRIVRVLHGSRDIPRFFND